MEPRQLPDVAPSAARRALIGLIADIAWAARTGSVVGMQEQARDEAMSLLARVDRGDRSAARRAMELVNATGVRAA